ncbi:MAG TPA: alpha/beta hydrolase [Acidimicrobiales bacterium]|nr:alpha/beta hydrolase [Acidimicrobiales bacterium]
MPKSDALFNQVVVLADGRSLGYAEYGKPDQPPLFLFHGLPGSRLDVPEMWSETPSNVRIIAPDRPGVGLSTFQPQRRLTDWSHDVRQLADSLGIERFLVAGFSGGGPHALAVAHGLSNRVIAAASISGAGMFTSPDDRKGMNSLNRLIFAVARMMPAVLWLIAAPHARQVKRNPTKVIDKAAQDKHVPIADREVLLDPRTREKMIDAGPEMFRQGVRGFIQEAHLAATPWDFDPSAIKPPVSFWHGEMDTNVPIQSIKLLAGRIAGSRVTIFPGEGHLIVPRHWNEIVEELLSFQEHHL